MKNKILLSVFIFTNYLQAETAKEVVLDFNAPSLWKYTIATKYKPGNKFVSINETIRLYKQIISKNDDKELVRASYYGLADIYFQIFYSRQNDSKYQKYQKLANDSLKMAMYLAPNKIFFNLFMINGQKTIQDMPPKFILTDYLYLAPIKMLFYLYLSGQAKHYDFKELDLKKADNYLDDLLRIRYIPSYKYKLKSILIFLQSDFKVQNKKSIEYIMDSLDIYNDGMQVLQTTNDLNRVNYYLDIKDIMTNINNILVSKFKNAIDKTDYQMYINALEQWNKKYEKRETTIYNFDKKVIADFKKRNKVQKKLSKIEFEKKEIERNKKFEIKRKRILKETGVDILKNNPYDYIINSLFNTK